MTALDSERLRQAQHAIEHPDTVEPEHRYLWALDMVACVAIVLILVWVAYQVADRLAS